MNPLIKQPPLLKRIIAVMAIGMMSISSFAFADNSTYPIALLDWEERSYPSEKPNTKAEIAFIQQILHADEEMPVVLDLRLGEFRPTAKSTTHNLHVTELNEADFLIEQSKFISVLVEKACHSSSMVGERKKGKSCNKIYFHFELPATIADYEPHIEKSHPLYAILEPNDSPKYFTYVLNAKEMEIESSEFNLRIFGYGRLYHLSGGQGQHSYGFNNVLYNPDKLFETLRKKK